MREARAAAALQQQVREMTAAQQLQQQQQEELQRDVDCYRLLSRQLRGEAEALAKRAAAVEWEEQQRRLLQRQQPGEAHANPRQSLRYVDILHAEVRPAGGFFSYLWSLSVSLFIVCYCLSSLHSLPAVVALFLFLPAAAAAAAVAAAWMLLLLHAWCCCCMRVFPVSLQLQQERKKCLSLEKQVLSLRVQLNILSPLRRLLPSSNKPAAMLVPQIDRSKDDLTVSSGLLSPTLRPKAPC